MVYSKRVHFELGHDAAADRWFVTGPTQHVDAVTELTTLDATRETPPPRTWAERQRGVVHDPRWLFPVDTDARVVAALCARLNTTLRETVWRKPDSAAGQKRARTAARQTAASAAVQNDDESDEDRE